MANENLTLTELLKRMTELRGSDLHITLNSPPQIRVDGHVHALSEFEPLNSADTKALAYSVLTDAQKHRFEEDMELDFSFGVKGLARFRANLFNQKGAVGAVFRMIPYEIKTFEQLNLPPIVQTLCDKPRGLILVTGPTGSGKSTTLAAMLDKINRDRNDHILTIEDPIEFLHNHKSCLVNQREVKADTRSFKDALKSALRQDPDVVLIGEMRDLETIEAALRIAETGHMTFGTLHTNSAAATINRVIDVFPAYQQSQIRAQLSMVLEGVLCQTLLPKAYGQGRCMALEILIPTPAIRNLIREDKIHQIYSMMQTGQEKYGMITLNQSLANLYFQKQITMESALQRSANPEELEDLINRGAGIVNFSGERASANTHVFHKLVGELNERGPGEPAKPQSRPMPPMPGQAPGMNPFPSAPPAGGSPFGAPPGQNANPFGTPPGSGGNPFGTPSGKR